MKSCDFLFLALLGIVSVDYDNRFACSSQSWNFVLRAFVILSWIRNPNNNMELKQISTAGAATAIVVEEVWGG